VKKENCFHSSKKCLFSSYNIMYCALFSHRRQEVGRSISHLTMVGLPGIITTDNFLYMTTNSPNKYFLKLDDFFFNSQFPRIQCVSCFTGLLKTPLTFNLNNRTVKACSAPEYGVFTCVLCTSCTDGHIHTYCFN
jgi:hypothetical protein